jgi:hypothetical protein
MVVSVNKPNGMNCQKKISKHGEIARRHLCAKKIKNILLELDKKT